MNASQLDNPVVQFPNLSGFPLDGGSVYVGIANLNPVTNPVTVYQDTGLTIPLSQPLGTVQGSIAINGTPIPVYLASGTYSLLVLDKSGNTILSLPQVAPTALTLNFGQMQDYSFVAGVGFTPGTTTVFTLPTAPGTIANFWLFFDAGFQADNQILTLEETVVTLVSPVPEGVEVVTFKVGQSIPLGVPSNGTVGAAQLAYPITGTTAQRPGGAPNGWPYLDTTLAPYGMPIMRSTLAATTGWVNGAGVQV